MTDGAQGVIDCSHTTEQMHTVITLSRHHTMTLSAPVDAVFFCRFEKEKEIKRVNKLLEII